MDIQRNREKKPRTNVQESPKNSTKNKKYKEIDDCEEDAFLFSIILIILNHHHHHHAHLLVCYVHTQSPDTKPHQLHQEKSTNTLHYNKML